MKEKRNLKLASFVQQLSPITNSSSESDDGSEEESTGQYRKTRFASGRWVSRHRVWSPRRLGRFKNRTFLLALLSVLVLLSFIGRHIRSFPWADKVDEVDVKKYVGKYKQDEYPKSVPMKNRVISSQIDSPFAIGCRKPDVDQPRANAAFVVLARNSEVGEVVNSMISMERHFNQWFNYPWVFLNDEEFDETFKKTVQKYTSSSVEFGTIPKKEWDFNEDIDKQLLYESIESQGDRTILYGNLASYHKMCRFYSGFFYKHELVKKRDWYWRVEPNVEFYCDLTYDPFIEMEKHGKKYGFNVMISELYYTVPGLFRETRAFIKKKKLKVGSAWRLFASNLKYSTGKNANKYDGIKNREQVLKDIDTNVNIEKLLKMKNKKDRQIAELDPSFVRALFRKADAMPNLYEDRIDDEEYNLCHFWSNFEIARTDLFTSPEYEAYFNHLENSGGFYKERWGDAPVHSLGVGMILNLEDIHYFRDIGYRHSTLAHCPANAHINQLRYETSKTFQRQDLMKDSYLIPPDKPTDAGIGCRCRCPIKYKEMEESTAACLKKWYERTHDSFTERRPLDVDFWEARINTKVDRFLDSGGELGQSRMHVMD